MSGETITLACERNCGHPDAEVETGELKPQFIAQCPNCGGPRVPFEPTEESRRQEIVASLDVAERKAEVVLAEVGRIRRNLRALGFEVDE